MRGGATDQQIAAALATAASVALQYAEGELCGCIKCIIHVRVQASRPTTSLGVTLPPKPCPLSTSSTWTSPPSPWTSAQRWPHPLSQLQVWWWLWGPAAVNAAVGLAVATLHNLAVRSHKATMLAFSIFTGWPLLPILDAQGNPPPATAGSCLETIDTLIGWRETLNGYSTDPELAGAAAELWTRLQFYQTPGPSGAPYVQAGAVLPDCHAGLGEPYETEMMGRLAAAALPSSGREFGRCRW